MVNTTSQALSVGNTITAGYGGLCLAFVSHCYGATAQYASAIACWNGQGAHNISTNNIADVPVGAPIFFSQAGNPYGHVALYAGDGMMRTTYSPDNKIHTMSIALWISWGYTLLGYSRAIENQIIPDLNITNTVAKTMKVGNDMPVKTDPIDWDGQNVTMEYAMQDLKHKLDAIGNAKHISDMVWFGQGDGSVQQTPLYTIRANQNAIERLAKANGLDMQELQSAVEQGVRNAIEQLKKGIDQS